MRTLKDHRRLTSLRRCRKTNVSKAYTLNEMLIVLAVLAALAALAWPALRKPLAKHELRAAAKQLRAQLAHVRLKAIQEGRPLQVRFAPGEGRYRIEAFEADQLAVAGLPQTNDLDGWNDSWNDPMGLDGGSDPWADDDLASPGGREAAPEELVEEKELPEDVHFVVEEDPGDQLIETAEPIVGPGSAAASDPMEQTGQWQSDNWSEPIVFYPNGRTSDAEIELAGDRDYRIQLTLRGITGAITVGALQRPPSEEEEPDPLVVSQQRASSVSAGPVIQPTRRPRMSTSLASP